MRIERPDHVQLAMPAGGGDALEAFYTGVPGIPETPKPHRAARGGCRFEGDARKLLLGADADIRRAKKARPPVIDFDLVALVERLRANGFPPVEAVPLDGYERRYADDPFGSRADGAVDPMKTRVQGRHKEHRHA